MNVLLRHGGGLPAFFSDTAIIEALHKNRNSSGGRTRIRHWRLLGGRWCRGRAFSFTGGDCYFNFLKILEIMLHEGVNPRTGVRLFETKTLEEYTSMEDLLEEFHHQLSPVHALHCGADGHYLFHGRGPQSDALYVGTADYRVEMGQDMSWGRRSQRTVFHTILQGHGTGDTCNALYALQKLVFDQHRLTLREFVRILDQD